jgi:putative SOS response-associated peptidase YedK
MSGGQSTLGLRRSFRSRMFRSAFSKRRCLVPVDAFYEWKTTQGGRRPYAIARQDGQPIAVAGLWEGFRCPDGTILRTFMIITTSANAVMADIHDRMPVVVEQSDWPVSLGEAEGDVPALLRPATDEALRTWPVGPLVNTPCNNGPELLEAIF